MIRSGFERFDNGRRSATSPGGTGRPCPAPSVARKTGPLGLLAGHRVLVVADCQNLDMGAVQLGLGVDWKRLGRKLSQVAHSASLHAFISEPRGVTRQSDYFVDCGWMPHSKLSRKVQSWQGMVSKKNTDHLIAFFTGVLASRTRATLVVIASGDGDLVEDLSEAMKMLPRPRSIVTLSIAGSTSQRLNAQRSAFVIENLEVGMDCLAPAQNRQSA